MDHKARNDGSMDDDMDQTWMTNGWWMTDAMCFLPTFQVETAPISQILPWSRTRPGPASESSSSSTATINMKSKLEVYDFQPRKHIYHLFSPLHHSNIPGFSSKILPSLPALWLAPDVGFAPTAGPAWQIGWRRSGRRTSVGRRASVRAKARNLKGDFSHEKAPLGKHMVRYGNINNG